MVSISELPLVQGDGQSPTTLAGGSAPGESGVAVFNMQFDGGVHFSATPQQHLVWFQLTDVNIECRRAGRSHMQDAPAGSLVICPAGIDCGADTEQSADALLVTVERGRFSVAAAEESSLEAELAERLAGLDKPLLGLAHTLALESGAGYPNGPLFWNDVASGFVDGLVARHSAPREDRTRGALSKAVLGRLKDHIMAHLDEPIEVAVLADIAGRSPFHFSRVFARSVGMTPHRYVVHLRLQRAVELVRDRQSSLAEIAARTGFADQSHLSRWARRVHGVPLTELA